MAGEKVIQLHKADDTSDKWYPITYTDCVKFKHLDGSTINNYFSLQVDEDLTHCFDTIWKNVPKAIGVKDSQHGGQADYFLNQLGSWVQVQGGGGNGTVNDGSAKQLAYYATSGNAVSGCSLFWDNTNGRLGIKKSMPDYALDVDGSIYASGGISCAASSSDIRLKTDVKPFKGLDIVNNMNYVQFKWNDTAVGLNSDDNKFFDKESTNYGVIAQDVEGVIDGLVFDMPNGYKGVKYEKLIPIMAQAIKELSAEVKELKKQIK